MAQVVNETQKPAAVAAAVTRLRAVHRSHGVKVLLAPERHEARNEADGSKNRTAVAAGTKPR